MLERRSYQCAAEMDAFVKLLLDEKVTSYLEIGSKFGGSLRSVGSSLPTGSRIASVDLNEHGPDLANVIADLCAEGQDARLIVGDSHHAHVVRRVRALGAFDAVFIDGDHSLEGVAADWKNYGLAGCRIVAFHDINSSVHRSVPAFWDELKQHYGLHKRIKEICLDSGHNGIGVLWHG